MTARLGFDDATVFTVPCTWLPGRWSRNGTPAPDDRTLCGPSGRRGQRLYPSPQEAFDAAWATDEIGPP